MVEVQKIPTRSRKKAGETNEVTTEANAASEEASTTAAAPVAPEVAAAPAEPKIDSLGRSYGTGRRKDSVARVYIKRGSGQVIINGKSQTEYFRRQTQLLILNQPFLVAGVVNQFDVPVTSTVVVFRAKPAPSATAFPALWTISIHPCTAF